MTRSRERTLVTALYSLAGNSTEPWADAVRDLLADYADAPVVLKGNPCLPLGEAAVYLGVNYRTLQRIVSECSELVVVHITPGPRGRRGLLQSDLDSFLAKRRIGGAA